MFTVSLERELYDLTNDPHELQSLQNDPSKASIINSLHAAMTDLADD